MTREPIKFLIINSFRMMVYIAYFAIIGYGVWTGIFNGGAVAATLPGVPEGSGLAQGLDVALGFFGGWVVASLVCGLIVTQSCVYGQAGASSAMTDFSMPPETLLQYLLETCQKAGASDADARLTASYGESVAVREGKLETIERDEDAGVSLRCFYGQKQASVSGADLSPEGLKTLAERCAKMAEAAPEDPYCGLLGVESLKQVSTCGAGWGHSERWVAATNGFSAYKTGGSSSLSLAALGEKDGAMERDYAGRSSRRRADRLSPREIGELAGQRTVERLGAERLPSQTAAVIYDRRVSTSLINVFMNAISGPSITRGVSFLKDRLGEAIFAPEINIYDDPFRERGMGTRGHDGEGMAVKKSRIIADGVLSEWLLNSPSARQLGLKPNGFGGVSFGNPPGISTSNVYMEAGAHSPAELMAQTGKGLLVTGMFSPSINPNSGDYSVGVSGMWYENGELAFPVSEVTIAGDLPSMFSRMVAGNDLELLSSRDAPSVLIEGMQIAGS